MRRSPLFLMTPFLLAAVGGCMKPSAGSPPPEQGSAGRPGPPSPGMSGAGGTGGSSAGGEPVPGASAGTGGGSIDPPGGSGGGSPVGGGAGSTGTDGATGAEAPGAPSAPMVDVGPTAAPPRAFQFPGIVTYWGQNSASRVSTDPAKHEKSLAETCQDNPQYEAVIVAFVIEFFSPENVDRTPRVNFSKHCTSVNAYDADHKRLYRCDVIARGINECQRMNKKVLISLGGANGDYGFANDDEARTFAQTTWDLFLGGQHKFRPFTTAILDGIDLDIEGGGSAGYTAYVRRLRELMSGDKSRPWYISAAPQCPTPDAHLGPGAGKALGDAPELFDFLNVQFYNNWCGGHNPDLLVQQFDAWAKVGPKILVGLPAHTASGTPFVPRTQLPGILNQVKNKPAFGGVMLWDAGSDMHSLEGSQTYSAFVKTLLP
jgi:chitinase